MGKRPASPIARRLASINMVASGTALVLACLLLMAYDFVTFRDTMLGNRSVQAQIVGSNTVTALTFDDPPPRNGRSRPSGPPAASKVPGCTGRMDGCSRRICAVRDTAPLVAARQGLQPAASGTAFDGLQPLHVTRPRAAGRRAAWASSTSAPICRRCAIG